MERHRAAVMVDLLAGERFHSPGGQKAGVGPEMQQYQLAKSYPTVSVRGATTEAQVTNSRKFAKHRPRSAAPTPLLPDVLNTQSLASAVQRFAAPWSEL